MRCLKRWLCKIPSDARGSGSPAETPPLASAFGDTDGEIFGRKMFRLKTFSAKQLFGSKTFQPKIFWPNNISAKKDFDQKFFRSQTISVDFFFGRKTFQSNCFFGRNKIRPNFFRSKLFLAEKLFSVKNFLSKNFFLFFPPFYNLFFFLGIFWYVVGMSGGLVLVTSGEIKGQGPGLVNVLWAEAQNVRLVKCSDCGVLGL